MVTRYLRPGHPAEVFIAPDVTATGFSADGTSLLVQYDVTHGDLPSLSIGIYRSSDGVTPGTLLQTEVVTDPADLQVGTGHQISIQPDLPDIEEDHFLIAVLDPDDVLTEPNEADNQLVFQGGVFLTSGETLYVQGSADGDTVQVSVPSTLDVTFNSASYSYALDNVSAIRILGHGGNDTITADSGITLSMSVFGGPGNDTISAGTGMDTLDGGPGADTIHGGTPSGAYGEAIINTDTNNDGLPGGMDDDPSGNPWFECTAPGQGRRVQ